MPCADAILFVLSRCGSYENFLNTLFQSPLDQLLHLSQDVMLTHALAYCIACFEFNQSSFLYFAQNAVGWCNRVLVLHYCRVCCFSCLGIFSFITLSKDTGPQCRPNGISLKLKFTSSRALSWHCDTSSSLRESCQQSFKVQFWGRSSHIAFLLIQYKQCQRY